MQAEDANETLHTLTYMLFLVLVKTLAIFLWKPVILVGFGWRVGSGCQVSPVGGKVTYPGFVQTAQVQGGMRSECEIRVANREQRGGAQILLAYPACNSVSSRIPI